MLQPLYDSDDLNPENNQHKSISEDCLSNSQLLFHTYHIVTVQANKARYHYPIQTSD